MSKLKLPRRALKLRETVMWKGEKVLVQGWWGGRKKVVIRRIEHDYEVDIVPKVELEEGFFV